MAGLGLEDDLPQGMSLIERMSTVVFPIERPAVMHRDAAPGSGRPLRSHPFRARPRPQSEHEPLRRRDRGDLTDPSPWRIPCLLACTGTSSSGCPLRAVVAADDELLAADLALGVDHAAFLRRFRPRQTVFKNLSG
jgi:hypothetical protein